MLIMNILLEIDDLDQKLQIWVNVVRKLKCTQAFIKFSTQSKSNMLIMDILLEIDDLHP